MSVFFVAVLAVIEYRIGNKGDTMKRVLIHVLLAYCLLLWACAAIERKPPKQTTKAPKSPDTTLIISDPSGAKIEINHEYVGDTPLSILIKTEKSWISGEIVEDLIIVAYPTGAGQYTQTKNLKGVKTPKRIYFNLFLKPRPDEEIDVNINP